tara:strand:- start:212 stop:1261 length:1050 start_codon:yes stop_codon:yes gene_type:complete
MENLKNNNINDLIDNEIDEETSDNIIEDKVIEYITYLDDNDKYFINFNTIYEMGEKLISNYKSDEYKEYKNKYKLLMSNYYNKKKYKINVNNSFIEVYNRNKDIISNKAIDKLKKPIIYQVRPYLEKLRIRCSTNKIELETEYTHLINNKNKLNEDIRNSFIKKREKFGKNLDIYYSLLYYFNKINNIKMSNKNYNLSKIYYQIDNKGILQPRINNININLNYEELEIEFKHISNKLELFNKIKEMIKNNDSKYKILLKEYLRYDKDNNNNFLKKIKNLKNKKVNDIFVFKSEDDAKTFLSSVSSNKNSSMVNSLNSTNSTKDIMTNSTKDIMTNNRDVKINFLEKLNN